MLRTVFRRIVAIIMLIAVAILLIGVAVKWQVLDRDCQKGLVLNVGIQIVVLLLLIAACSGVSLCLYSWLIKSGGGGYFSRIFRGARQMVDSTSSYGLMEKLDDLVSVTRTTKRSWVIILIVLSALLLNRILYSIVTGVVVNGIERHGRLVETGVARYELHNHGVVVGWDFQGPAAIRMMLNQYSVSDVLIMSEQQSETIRDELRLYFSPDIIDKQIHICHGSVFLDEDMSSLHVENSRCVMVLNDISGKYKVSQSVNAADKLIAYVDSVLANEGRSRVDDKISLFVDVDLAISNLSYKESKNFYRRNFNFNISSLYEAFSPVGRILEADNDSNTQYDYSTFHFGGTNGVHVVVIGSNDMAKAIVQNIVRLIGIGERVDRVSVIGLSQADCLYGQESVLEKDYYGVKMHYYDAIDNNLAERNIAIRQDEDTTILVCDNLPMEALRIATSLPKAWRFCGCRLMIEQHQRSELNLSKSSLRRMGYRDIEYFGNTDTVFDSFYFQEKLHAHCDFDNKSNIFCETNIEWLWAELLARRGLRMASCDDGDVSVLDVESIITDAQSCKMVDIARVNCLLLKGYRRASRTLNPLRYSNRLEPLPQASYGHDLVEYVRFLQEEIVRHNGSLAIRRMNLDTVVGIIHHEHNGCNSSCYCSLANQLVAYWRKNRCAGERLVIIGSPVDYVSYDVMLYAAYGGMNARIKCVISRSDCEKIAALPDGDKDAINSLLQISEGVVELQDPNENTEEYIRTQTDKVFEN